MQQYVLSGHDMHYMVSAFMFDEDVIDFTYTALRLCPLWQQNDNLEMVATDNLKMSQANLNGACIMSHIISHQIGSPPLWKLF